MTDIPDEFRRLACLMHQDIDRVVSMEDEMELVRYLAGGLRKDEARSTADVLDKLLSSGRNDGNLASLWIKAGSEWRVSPKGIRRLLTTLRDYLRDRSR